MPSDKSREIRVNALAALKEFQSGAMRGFWDGSTYVVYSYAVLIASKSYDGELCYYNGAKYSATTSGHQSAVRQAWEISA